MSKIQTLITRLQQLHRTAEGGFAGDFESDIKEELFSDDSETKFKIGATVMKQNSRPTDTIADNTKGAVIGALKDDETDTELYLVDFVSANETAIVDEVNLAYMD